MDDEAELLESHRIFLREKGYEVETATNADDAVEAWRKTVTLSPESKIGVKAATRLAKLGRA